MRGSEFVAAYRQKSPAAWEAAALAAARSGQGFARWPLVPVTLTKGGHALTFLAASDYFAIGETLADAVRLPLTPLTAQRIADGLGMMLPTSRMVRAIHRAAPVKLVGIGGIVPNKGAVLDQYAEHDARAVLEIAGRWGQLTSGHKKDVVVGQPSPGKVVIYGWIKVPEPPEDDANLWGSAAWRVQPYSTVHGDSYVDYSHGIRLVAPEAVLDGEKVDLRELLRDPAKAAIASDVGPFKGEARYPVPKDPNAPAVAYVPVTPPLAEQGLNEVQHRVLERSQG